MQATNSTKPKTQAWPVLLALLALAPYAASAQGDYVTIALSGYANARIQTYQPGASAYPEGMVTLGGVPFNIQQVGGNNAWNAEVVTGPYPHVLDIAVGVANATEVHTLINTFYGQPGPNSYVTLEFFGSGGAYYRKDLIGDVDVRDHLWAFWTTTINGTTTINVFSTGGGFLQDNRLDKQQIVLPPEFQNQTLTTVRLTSTGGVLISDASIQGLTVKVSANHPPVANDQSVTTDQDTPVSITLSATDADNDPLTYLVVTPPSHGTLSGTAPNLTYTPDPGFTGQENFTFKANDGQADSGIATVTITVRGQHIELVEPSDDVYYLDQNNYTETSVPLQARLVPPGSSNPAVSWTLTLHTKVGPHERDVIISVPDTHAGDALPLFLRLSLGGDLEIKAASMTDTGVPVEIAKTVRIRGLQIPHNVVATALGDDLRRAVCWRESEFHQFIGDGLPYITLDSNGTFDIGLMQINSPTWTDFPPQNMDKNIELYGWNWQANISKANAILAFCHQKAIKWRNDNRLQGKMSAAQVLEDALCRYHTGPNNGLYKLVNGQLQDNNVEGRRYVDAVRLFEQTKPWQ